MNAPAPAGPRFSFSPSASRPAHRCFLQTRQTALLSSALRMKSVASGAWAGRAGCQLVHAGLRNAGGFPQRVAKYLGKKYGYKPRGGVAAGPQVADLLGMLIARLRAQVT
jgi:hypothetical protein